MQERFSVGCSHNDPGALHRNGVAAEWGAVGILVATKKRLGLRNCVTTGYVFQFGPFVDPRAAQLHHGVLVEGHFRVREPLAGNDAKQATLTNSLPSLENERGVDLAARLQHPGN